MISLRLDAVAAVEFWAKDVVNSLKNLYRNIHALFKTKMVEKAHEYCGKQWRFRKNLSCVDPTHTAYRRAF